MNKFIYFNIFLLAIFSNLNAQNGCDTPGDEGNSMVNNMMAGTNIIIDILNAFDPNDITGDQGYDQAQWVSINDRLGYTIRFENDPNFATAPAQIVKITQVIEEDLDLYSVELGDFGFGDFIFQVPSETTHYTTRLDVVDSLGVLVDVIAGIDVPNQELFWIFESKDPQTGLPPEDALVGFLPVNDTLSRYNDTIPKAGEGFVTYSIQPHSSAVTCDTAHAQATIIFDENEPIPTNIWANKIDALPPVSEVNTLPNTLNTTTFMVSWTGTDDTGGVGVATYNLYASQDDGPFVLYAANLFNHSLEFTGQAGSTYSFFTLATDHVGNQEAPKSAGEQTVTIDETALEIDLQEFDAFVMLNQDVYVEWHIARQYGLSYFELERRTHQGTWKKIATIYPNHSQQKFFNYKDEQIFQQLKETQLYYRLKIVEQDASFSYSNIRPLSIEQVPKVKIFPNPTLNPIRIQMTAFEEQLVQFALFSLEGRLLQKNNVIVTTGDNQLEISINGQRTGTYLLKITSEDFRIVEQVIVLK